MKRRLDALGPFRYKEQNSFLASLEKGDLLGWHTRNVYCSFAVGGQPRRTGSPASGWRSWWGTWPLLFCTLFKSTSLSSFYPQNCSFHIYMWPVHWSPKCISDRLSRMAVQELTPTLWTASVEKAMAPHSSAIAWKIPWMEEPGRLQSMGSLRVRHDWATSLSLFTFMHWRRKWQPTPVFLPGESQGRGSLVGCRLGSHRVRHDWSDLAAAAAAVDLILLLVWVWLIHLDYYSFKPSKQ